METEVVTPNAATQPAISCGQNTNFDLRILQVEETQWRTRLLAALDIIEEGNPELIGLCIIPMLSDRSEKVRAKIHRKLISYFGVYFPPYIGFARKEMLCLEEMELICIL